jgi:hypothetical protein
VAGYGQAFSIGAMRDRFSDHCKVMRKRSRGFARKAISLHQNARLENGRASERHQYNSVRLMSLAF